MNLSRPIIKPHLKTASTSGGDLASRLQRLASSDRDYWSFKGNARRDHGHGLMQYPAMMVPQMVRALLTELCVNDSDIRRVADPFVGSGTVMTEAMLGGLDFLGRDINPLAILLCRVKAGPIFPEALNERADELLKDIRATNSTRIEANFAGIDKWFRADVQVALSRIRRRIRREKSIWARRFFWVAIGETVRLCSNSRTSTFKLHIRDSSERDTRNIDPLATFDRIVRRNLLRYKSLGVELRNRQLLEKGHYTGHVQTVLSDSRTIAGPAVLQDAVITSPPYGDNTTTVPYGQYSFLPLQWIDLDDIDPDAEAAYLSTTHEIDRRSLGGVRKVADADITQLKNRSATFAQTLSQLCDQPEDRAFRVAAFVRDLDACLPKVLSLLRPAGVMMWVLGNRRVGGRSVPLDRILTELLVSRGTEAVTTIRRRIPSKRMAIRNSVAKTMANETILVLRKAAENAKNG